MKIIKIDTAKIIDWDTFHYEFKMKLGFPEYYGNNMDAWIDCMSDLGEGEVVTLELNSVKSFKKRCPGQYDALVDAVAFVNYRLIEHGEIPAVMISNKI